MSSLKRKLQHLLPGNGRTSTGPGISGMFGQVPILGDRYNIDGQAEVSISSSPLYLTISNQVSPNRVNFTRIKLHDFVCFPYFKKLILLAWNVCFIQCGSLRISCRSIILFDMESLVFCPFLFLNHLALSFWLHVYSKIFYFQFNPLLLTLCFLSLSLPAAFYF